jgi:lipopolysaccharide transport system permease protein
MILAGQAAILNTGQTTIPYPALVLIGTCLWQTFSEALMGPIQAVNQSKALLARIRFPLEAILLAKLGEVVLNTVLRTALIGLALALYQVPLSWSLPLGGPGLLSLILLGMSVGVLLAPLGGLFNDVMQGMTLVLGLWMFLTPVVYEHAQPGSVVERLNSINPVTPLLVTTREWITGQACSNPGGFALVTIGSAVLLVAAWQFFRFAMSFAIERVGA